MKYQGSLLVVTKVVAALTLCAGCSSASSASSGILPQSVASDSGKLRLELSATTQPVVGTNAIDLTVTDATGGAPVDGLAVSVVPWMPAMDHGTSSPSVIALGSGKYRITSLYFFMPGTWELQTSFSGPVTDHATPTLQIQ